MGERTQISSIFDSSIQRWNLAEGCLAGGVGLIDITNV